jgi:hypothetical protein
LSAELLYDGAISRFVTTVNDPANQPGHTPLWTEVAWLLAVLVVAFVGELAGTIYFVWRLLEAGAGC